MPSHGAGFDTDSDGGGEVLTSQGDDSDANKHSSVFTENSEGQSSNSYTEISPEQLTTTCSTSGRVVSENVFAGKDGNHYFSAAVSTTQPQIHNADEQANATKGIVASDGDQCEFARSNNVSFLAQTSSNSVQYVGKLSGRYRPSNAQRTALIILIGVMFVIDTCATTVFIPLVPRYFQTNDTEFRIGVLFGVKAVAQIIANPGWGAATDHFGGILTISLTTSLYIVVMLMNAFAAASGARYAVVVAARVLLGIASAGAGTGGPALIAAMYTEAEGRSTMLGRVLTGYAIGAMIGAPVGGAFSTYADIDKAWQQPFLILTGMCVLQLIFVLVLGTRLPKTFRCTSQGERRKSTPIWKLLLDPYIVNLAVIACVANMAVSALDPLLPEWAEEHFTPAPGGWEVGLAFLPLFAAYFVTTPLLGQLTLKYNKCPPWILAMGSMFIGSGSIVVLPFLPAGNFWLLVLPMLALGVGMGAIDIVTYMVMGTLMDCRHSSTYGNVYAISDIAFSANYFLAPFVATGLAQRFGNDWAFYSLSILLAALSPLALLVRHEEKNRKPQLQDRVLRSSHIHVHPGIIQISTSV
eukprot:scpid36863/ scgid16385/ Probable vesicular acetylcholine transporter-A; Solute carrier family 18 member 3-A